MSITETSPFLSTKNKLVEILTAGLKELIVGDTRPLKQVYGYLNKDADMFPCAMVDHIEASREERFEGLGVANGTNKVIMYFLVRVEMPNGNSLDITDQRLSLADQITALMRSSANVDTLDNEVEIWDVDAIAHFEHGEADMKRTGFDMIIMAEKLMPVI